MIDGPTETKVFKLSEFCRFSPKIYTAGYEVELREGVYCETRGNRLVSNCAETKEQSRGSGE